MTAWTTRPEPEIAAKERMERSAAKAATKERNRGPRGIRGTRYPNSLFSACSVSSAVRIFAGLRDSDVLPRRESKVLYAVSVPVHPEVGGGLNWRPGARLCQRPAAALGQGNALRLVEDDTAALPPTTSGCTAQKAGRAVPCAPAVACTRSAG